MRSSSCWLVILLIVVCVHRAEAQQPTKVPRIGILPPGPISERVHLWEAFRQGLRELGYIEGKNIILIFPSGKVTPERLPDLAAELINLKVDIIVAPTTAGALEVMKSYKGNPYRHADQYRSDWRRSSRKSCASQRERYWIDLYRPRS